MTNLQLTPEQIATACSQALHANDRCAQSMGIEVLSCTPGHSTLQMTVTDEMSNGHGICHGGMIFTLADTAFAHACNSTNYNTVASGCSIDFLAAGKLGEQLTASATERSRSGKTGLYDITITNQEGLIIALFRGKSYQIRGNLISPTGESQ